MNKYITSTLFTGLFVTASFLPSAIAAEQSLQPQGAWSITKVDREAQGGNSYCTLSRKYNDGIVLSLGRNQAEEYSLAIDFQKGVFKKDKTVKINLQPGPGQIRSYDLMPTSDNAIVVRLGWDAGFFDTLNQSQQMKVKVADNAYSFALPEITKGQNELQDCMKDLKTAAKGDAPAQKTASKDVLNAEPVSASKEFAAGKVDEKAVASAAPVPAQKDVAEATEQKIAANTAKDAKAHEPEIDNEDAPKRRNFGTKGASDVAAKDAAPKEMQVAKAEKEPVEIRRPRPPDAEQDKTAEEVAMTAPAAGAKKAEKPSDKADKNSDKKDAELQKRLAAISAENETLKKQSSAPSADAQKQIETLQAEKKRLQEKADVAENINVQKANNEVAKLQDKAKELEIKNAQLEDTVRKSQIRIGETAINTETRSIKRIADLEIKLEAAQNDNNTLAKQLESYRAQKEDGRLSLVAGDWDLEQATKRYNESERETQRLAQQLEQERMSCNREKAQIEKMLFDPAVTDQKQIQRLSALETELKAAQTKIDNQKKAVDDAVAQQVAAKTQQMESEKAALSQQVASLQKSLTDKDAVSTADKAAMEQKLAALQKAAGENQGAAAEKATLSQQVVDLKSALTAKEAAEASQKTSLQAQIDTLKGAIAKKDQELAALNAVPKVDPAAAEQRVAAEVGKARQAADEEVGKVRAAADQEIISLRTQNKAMADQHKAMAESVEAMKVALANKDTALAGKDKAIAEAQSMPKTDPVIMKQIADMQTNLAAIKKDNDGLRDQNIVLRQQSDKLQLQLTEAQGNGAARVDKVASMQLELEDLKRQIARKDTQNVTYQNQMAALQQETAQLKQRLTVSDSTKTSSTAEVGDLTRQVQQLQKQITDMGNRQAAAANDRSAMATQYSNIQPAAGVIAAAPVQAVAAVMPAPANIQPVAIAPAAATSGSYDQGSIKSLLQKAGLNINGIQKTSGFSGADNFGWMDSSNVKGTASVKVMSGSGFDALVGQYLAYQKAQCGGGDFASMPSPSNGSAAKQMALYEVACVKGGQGMSSSLIFFEDQGRFIAISNEIAAADMDIAMDSRDKIAGLVRGL